MMGRRWSSSVNKLERTLIQRFSDHLRGLEWKIEEIATCCTFNGEGRRERHTSVTKSNFEEATKSVINFCSYWVGVRKRRRNDFTQRSRNFLSVSLFFPPTAGVPSTKLTSDIKNLLPFYCYIVTLNCFQDFPQYETEDINSYAHLKAKCWMGGEAVIGE